MTWEYYAAAAILLFIVSQLLMAFLSLFFYPVVKEWKEMLSSSQSILAKLALTIYF